MLISSIWYFQDLCLLYFSAYTLKIQDFLLMGRIDECVHKVFNTLFWLAFPLSWLRKPGNQGNGEEMRRELLVQETPCHPGPPPVEFDFLHNKRKLNVMRNTTPSAIALQHISDNVVWRELTCACTREKGVIGFVHPSHSVDREFSILCK